MTVPQVPAGVLLDGMPPQYAHVPAQLLLQQTPSTQFPVLQWSVAVQLVPFPYFDVQVPAQVVAQQIPEMQLPCAHWLFLLQVAPSDRVVAQVMEEVQ